MKDNIRCLDPVITEKKTMKATKGKANPGMVNKILKELL